VYPNLYVLLDTFVRSAIFDRTETKIMTLFQDWVC